MNPGSVLTILILTTKMAYTCRGAEGQCGNTDSNFFCSRPQISTKTGSLKFSNK
jgi:hypothetical protein